ncbi:hypothetical protein HJA89_10140 [Rhizobium bangladeshense]|uniref:hypothetical protein n=1 Tax=Rhizobium TaxID=379 RepID=UPI001C82D111|nr:MULTISPECIES: hypothetical protein [Rhizobium]MBX4873260.1 hypothetical protein [Rhizobium bangladeshense]MBX4884637.1 hypothetical protein [Rhizobium bangladeshense]MBX5146350.1 hypothetical protein [Rhizobium lentis]
MREVSADKLVVEAAQWLVDQLEPVAQVIPILRDRFGITATQAALACTLANTMRTLRRAHG